MGAEAAPQLCFVDPLLHHLLFLLLFLHYLLQAIEVPDRIEFLRNCVPFTKLEHSSAQMLPHVGRPS